MIDYVKIKLKAGKGGNGAASFQRLRGRPYGPPDGGDGGEGGNVYLVVSRDLTTLIPYRYKKHFEAKDGVRGAKNHRKGKSGEDLFLSVPAGTRVMDASERLFADLTRMGEKVMVAKGGKGGRGNMHIKRSEIRGNTPGLGRKSEAWRWFEKGEEGQEIELILELKLLADIGLIGLPNAGKSTLLSKLTAATPKIASYEFTTLEPNLGVMRHKGKEIVLADIPGLIEGASKGKGLGVQFLRHVERTKILVHLISIESEDPVGDLKTVDDELKKYSEVLGDKPQVYLLTKIDIVDLEDFENKVSQFKKKRVKVLPVSSVTGDGLEELQDAIITSF
jgi:GTP-binding protein